MAKQRFSIVVQKFLTQLQACNPLASNNREEQADKTQIKIVATTKGTLSVAATDGQVAGIVTAPLEDSPQEDLHACVLATKVPTLIKLLRQVDAEKRLEDAVIVTVTGRKLRAEIKHTDGLELELFDEQLEFPDVARVLPERIEGDGMLAQGSLSVDAGLLGRVLRSAGKVGERVQWSSPKAPGCSLRLDVEGDGQVVGVFACSQRRADAEPVGEREDDGEDEVDSAQQDLVEPDGDSGKVRSIKTAKKGTAKAKKKGSKSKK